MAFVFRIADGRPDIPVLRIVRSEVEPSEVEAGPDTPSPRRPAWQSPYGPQRRHQKHLNRT